MAEATGGTTAPSRVPSRGYALRGGRPPYRLGRPWQGAAQQRRSAIHSKWEGLGEKITVNAQINDKNIWRYSPNNLQNNLYTWNALPSGNMMSNLTRFENIFSYGFWWSSTEKDSNSGEYRYIYFDSPDFPYSYVAKEYFGASVRCVRKSL